MSAEEIAALGLGLASLMSRVQLEEASLLFSSISIATIEHLEDELGAAQHDRPGRQVGAGADQLGVSFSPVSNWVAQSLIIVLPAWGVHSST